jgi:hypothetical protein
MALPLISLELAEVKIHIEFANIEDCIIIAPSHFVYVNDSIIPFNKYELL